MASNQLTRQELIALVDEIRDSSTDDGRFSMERQLEEHFPEADVLNLCESDLPSDTIIDFCLGFEQTKRLLNRQELLELVASILSGDSDSEADEMLMIETFLRNCRHPSGTDLIFYPETVFGDREDLTADMIVEKAFLGE
jgi:hypothetical protein